MPDEERLDSPEELDAFVRGYLDGKGQPDELTSGLTYQDGRLNETYDRGVNRGQVWARLRRREKQADGGA